MAAGDSSYILTQPIVHQKMAHHHSQMAGVYQILESNEELLKNMKEMY